jgi:crossover junction endodeoxyribonuclease RuvC
MKVVSIDPGYDRVGIAVLEKKEAETERLIFSECHTTSSADSFHDRLCSIGERVTAIIDEFSPDALAIETVYFNTNQKTATKVSEAKGVMVFCALQKGIKVFEYTPLQIKMAVSGYGRSEKSQVTAMVKKLVKIEKSILHDDEFDAIAVGITHLASQKILLKLQQAPH